MNTTQQRRTRNTALYAGDCSREKQSNFSNIAVVLCVRVCGTVRALRSAQADMTWLRVHVREGDEDEEDVVVVCAIHSAALEELGLQGGISPFPLSSFITHTFSFRLYFTLLPYSFL